MKMPNTDASQWAGAARPAAGNTPGVDVFVQVVTTLRGRHDRGAVAWLWLLLLPIGLLLACSPIVGGGPDYMLLGLFLSATSRTIYRYGRSLEAATAALQFGNLDDRWLGATAEAIDWPNWRVRAIARMLLPRLLAETAEGTPSLTAEGTPSLTDDQRDALYRAMTVRYAWREPHLTAAIVAAMPRLGDAHATPLLARLALMRCFTRGMRAVRHAARVALPELEARLVVMGCDARADHLAPVPNSSDNATNRATDHATVPSRSDRPDAPPISAPASPLASAQMAALDAEAQRHQQPGMRIGFLVATWCLPIPYFLYMGFESWQRGNLYVGMVFLLAAVAVSQLYRLTLTPRQKELAHQLANLHELQAVGQLAEALEWPDEECRKTAARALTQLLPQMKASDVSLLDSVQRGKIYRMLRMTNAGRYGDFMLAALRALEQIGDTEAVPYVEALSAATATTTRQRNIRQAAMDCLPYLQACAEQNRHSQLLLRASSAAGPADERLVRPMAAPGLADPAVLIRPSEAPGSVEGQVAETA